MARVTAVAELGPWPDFSASDLRALLLLATLITLAVLERRRSARPERTDRVRRSYFINLGLMVLNEVLMALLSITALWSLAERYAEQGLLSGLSNRGLRTIAAFLLLDLTLYLWHRANHRYDALWQFHRTHHSDRCMNASTAFRLHGVETILGTAIKAAFIAVVGVDTTLLLTLESLMTGCVVFHHANWSFPGERRLGGWIVTPSQHRVHHSSRREQHDHNYGAVLSCWDRLFGTYLEDEPVELGLPGRAPETLWAVVRDGVPPAFAAAARRLLPATSRGWGTRRGAGGDPVRPRVPAPLLTRRR